MKAKDLRNSILQMAVEGKLVPQDPNDEPSSALLERIRAERAKLIKEKKIKAPKGGESVIYRDSDGSRYEKRGKGEPVCIEEEIPFEIPDSWEWARLEQLCNVIVDCPHSTPTYLMSKTGYAAIDTNCIDEEWHLTGLRHLSKESYESRVSRYVPRVGDLVFTREGSIGRSLILRRRNVCLGQRVMLMSTNRSTLSNRYCQVVLSSPYAWSLYRAANVGTGVKHINVSMVKSLLIPLPPLAEQRRIVERVSELMPLVEKYGELEDARNRVNVDLPDKIRKSVLQQAVEGRLVEQDASDEPASELLARIRAERAKLVREKKLKLPRGGESVIYRASDGRRYEKRGKGEPVCIDDEIPFDIPDSWEWARLGSIASVNSGLGYKKPDLNVQGERMIRVLRGGNIGDGRQPLIKDSDIMISAQFVEDSLILHDGQIITPAVTSLDNVAKAALIENSDGNTVCGGFVFCITPYLSDKVFSGFMYYCLSAPFHVSFCRGSVKKSGQAFYNLSKTALSSALIPLPPLAEQRRIVERVQELFKLIA